MTKRIVNHINFVRGEDSRVSPEVLFDTFRRQVELCRSYPLPYTFLLQYDAMVRPEYAALLKENRDVHMEIGVWIEMAQEQVERAGIPWRGRPGYKWDWFVNPDMLVAYTPPQRKALIDELMSRFHEIFGFYPRSAGSWMLDSFSVAYLKEAYHVDAICICKEQYGTDGYTLWGGYYNQGYYPSRRNLFMPAQTEEEQISVPVFRMLGSDPIYQYDDGVDEDFTPRMQTVVTLEPAWVYGQDAGWVDWYLHSNFEEEGLCFSYTQAGQENSFTWEVFGEALSMQLEKIAAGVRDGRWEVMTLGDTGRWYQETLRQTPATAVTALEDWKGEGRQSIWYSCRHYRLNLYREEGAVSVRDIQLFDEQYPDRYWDTTAQGNTAVYDALPIVDGLRWGGGGIRALWRFVRQGTDKPADGLLEKAEQEGENGMLVTLLMDGVKTLCRLDETGVTLQFGDQRFDLLFRYHTLADTVLEAVEPDRVLYRHQGRRYGLRAAGARFQPVESGFRLTACAETVSLTFLRDAELREQKGKD